MALNWSRRQSMTQTAAWVAINSLRNRAQARDAQPSMSFPVDPRARLSLTSYPFRGWIESPTNRGRDAKLPGMDLKDFPSFAVQKFGISNINPLVDHFRSTEQRYLDEFRLAVEKARSRIVDLGLPGGRFYADEESIRRQAISLGMSHIDIAAGVGSPSVRQHISGDTKPSIDLAAESLGKLADYAGKRNIVINLENDSAISEDPFFLVAVMNKVNHPYLRGLPDFGNSLMGHDQAFNHRAVDAMLNHVFNVCHVKNELAGQNGAHYQVDLDYMFKLAKRHSFAGFFCMEFDSRSGDPIQGTTNLVKESLRYLA